MTTVSVLWCFKSSVISTKIKHNQRQRNSSKTRIPTQTEQGICVEAYADRYRLYTWPPTSCPNSSSADESTGKYACTDRGCANDSPVRQDDGIGVGVQYGHRRLRLDEALDLLEHQRPLQMILRLVAAGKSGD